MDVEELPYDNFPEWYPDEAYSCLLCGQQGNSKHSASINESALSPWSNLADVDPEKHVACLRVLKQLGEGEIHPSCLNELVDNGSMVDPFVFEIRFKSK
jgi:hypothetical protein